MSAYRLDFSGLADYVPSFLSGLATTAEIAAIVTVLGISVGIIGGVIRNSRRKHFLYRLWTCYVEAIRNTPFIVQLFFIFFGMPQMGVRISAEAAAIISLTVNLGAYATEIVRAALAVTPQGQWEACRVLGISRAQAYRHVVIPPALRKVCPALIGQCVLVMLGSAVISQISCEDITYAASYAQSITFLSLEAYMVAAALYLLLAIAMRQALLFVGRLVFRELGI